MMEKCPYCGYERIAKRGFTDGKQRYRCHNCRKSFSERKIASAKKNWVLQLYLNSVSQRRISQLAEVSRKTIQRWIKEKEAQAGFACLTPMPQNYAEKEIIMIKNLKKYLKEEQKGETYALLLTSKGSVALDLR